MHCENGNFFWWAWVVLDLVLFRKLCLCSSVYLLCEKGKRFSIKIALVWILCLEIKWIFWWRLHATLPSQTTNPRTALGLTSCSQAAEGAVLDKSQHRHKDRLSPASANAAQNDLDNKTATKQSPGSFPPSKLVLREDKIQHFDVRHQKVWIYQATNLTPAHPFGRNFVIRCCKCRDYL